jgi:hypothetical protein
MEDEFRNINQIRFSATKKKQAPAVLVLGNILPSSECQSSMLMSVNDEEI